MPLPNALHLPVQHANIAPSPHGGLRFWLAHLVVPTALFALLALALFAFDGDLRWADRLYAWQGHSWEFRKSFLADGVMHVGGRNLSLLAWVAVLVAWWFAGRRDTLQHLRKPLFGLLMTVLVATTLVAWFKSFSNMDCPWDLQRYGGARPYVELLQMRPVGLHRGVCFPAGHASAGYAWLGLYFFFLVVRPQWRWRGLAVGLLAGLAFGVTQQLRGAHFISHDLWTAAICWCSACLVFALQRPSEDAHASLVAASAAAREARRLALEDAARPATPRDVPLRGPVLR